MPGEERDGEYGKIKGITANIGRRGSFDGDEEEHDGFTYLDDDAVDPRLDDDADRTVAAAQAAVMAVYTSDQDKLQEAGGKAVEADPEGYGNLYDDLREE